ncbi:hypothetical protein ACN9MY_01775 [Pseudoduganella sp. R-31]|uniref:DISARM anti-phage system protein DrmE domain-containing protein n=1 Tax=Pseudoduganella sp. R-31 TaxID=3404060 RepID=UPI003CF8DBA9
MWDGAIQYSTQRVTDALLHRAVLPRDALAFEKVTGAIAVRACLASGEQSLLFVVPEANASTARHVIAALLIGNHAHANAYDALPVEEVRHLLRGDIVFVTQAISASKAKLEQLQVGKGQRLTDIWDVTTLSKYSTAKTSKPRVLLANPGWLEKVMGGRRFGAVVIDASHPNTFARLPELLRAASGCTSLRIAVSPPPTEAALLSSGYPSKLQVWMWDPQAKCDAETVVEEADPIPHAAANRFLWICDSDLESADALAKVYKSLCIAVKAAQGRSYPGLRQCWAIYNRLRQVAVPLAQLEQVAARTWSGNLRRQIEGLKSVSGYGNVAWDTTWPELLANLKEAYETLLRRGETAKFWALASNLEAFLASSTPSLRVVVGSEAEVALLVPALESIIDGFSEAVVMGKVDFVNSNSEGRLIAEGNTCPTILLAPRTNGHRYLDVFPSSRVDELLYPHEVDIERNSQYKLHIIWEPRLADEKRVQFLAPYGFPPKKSSRPRVAVQPPSVIVQKTNGHIVSTVRTAEVSAQIDIEALAGYSSSGLFDGHEPGFHVPTGALGAAVEICFTNGERRQFNEFQKVDVYFSEALALQRHSAKDVRPGWQLIAFVDGEYEGLFQRLTDAVNSRLPQSERIALELWRKAKEHLVNRFDTKRELFDKLVSKGLTSSYGTFITWFGDDEDGVIAPQQFDEFKVLAAEIEVYSSSSLMMNSAFKAVQQTRGRNRALGRALRKFLRAVITGCGYEEALTSASNLDSAIGDVFAAVEVLEVNSVSKKI